jgi:hypothetical protein
LADRGAISGIIRFCRVQRCHGGPEFTPVALIRTQRTGRTIFGLIDMEAIR